MKTQSVALIFCALTVLSALNVPAVQVTNTYADLSSPATTDWDHVVNLDRLPAAGIMNSVTLTVTIPWASSMVASNNNLTSYMVNTASCESVVFDRLNAGYITTILDEIAGGGHIQVDPGTTQVCFNDCRTNAYTQVLTGTNAAAFAGTGTVPLEVFTTTYFMYSISGGNYWASIRTLAGLLVTAVYDYTPVPVIVQSPQSATNVVGSSVDFSVSATSDTPLTYQWQFNGTNLDGATAQVLKLTNVQPSSAGSYQVVVSNSFGSTTSMVAVLTILQYAWSPISSSSLTFEDLKLSDWCDWDCNDVVLSVTSSTETNNLAQVRSVSIDYDLLACGAGLDHGVFVTLPIVGGATATVTTWSAQGDLQSSTCSSSTGTVTLTVFPSTHGAFSTSTTLINTDRGSEQYTSRHVRVSLALADPANNPVATFPAAPFDSWIYVYYTGADIHRVACKLDNMQIVQFGPLAGRPLPLVLEVPANFAWPASGIPIWLSYPSFTDFIVSGMVSPTNWWTNVVSSLVWVDAAGLSKQLASSSVRAAGAAVSSLAAGAAITRTSASSLALEPGWPQRKGANVFASPIARDLLGDGGREVLLSTLDGGVHIFRADGSELPGWPKQVEPGLRAAPGVGRLDKDPHPAIVVGADVNSQSGKIYAWHLDGSAVSGFPVTVAAPVKCVPSVIDVNGDGQAEIVFYAGDGNLYVTDAHGVPLPGWPVRLAGDADLYGSWFLASSPVVLDLYGDGKLEIVVGSSGGKVYVFHADGTLADGWPQSTGGAICASVTPVDLDGDFLPELVVGSGDGGIYAWHADGTAVAGFPVNLGSAVAASVAAGDLKGSPVPCRVRAWP